MIVLAKIGSSAAIRFVIYAQPTSSAIIGAFLYFFRAW